MSLCPNLCFAGSQGYLEANSASAYSMVSMVQKFGPIMNQGGSALSLTYIASEKVIPGYGGGMSSAKVRPTLLSLVLL
jgi:enoyl-[acyl-carrier protein] reductase I